MGFSMAVPERPKGFLAWWRLLNSRSVAAAPYQMIFIGGFVITIGLSLIVATLVLDFRVPILAPAVGLLVVGALGIYGGFWRIKNDAKTR
jgi:hypothetical protein